MDQIKLLVKDVLHKIQDIPDVPFTPTRPGCRMEGGDSKRTQTSDIQNNNGSQGSLERPLQNRIIMGKRALLRSRSSDLGHDQASVVHDLVNQDVNEKYADKISHYISRMHHRRLSRDSRSTDDTSSNYSGSESYFSLLFPSPPASEHSFAPEEFLSSTIHSMEELEVEYDPHKFLKAALGDITVSSNSLEDSRPGELSLLSRAGSFCTSMRRSIRRACSFSKANPEPSAKIKARNRCQSYSPDCEGSSENLMRELYVQNGIIFQASKALNYCRGAKDLTSPQYIEAEKILLVALCHKEALQTALDSFDEEPSDPKSSGTLEISELVFFLKEQPPQKTFEEYFVIIITSGKTVLSSTVLSPNNRGEIRSTKKFRITGLSTNFEASIAIYSMKIPLGHDPKKEGKAPCPSAKSLFHLNHRASRRSLVVDEVSTIRPSAFTLWGSCAVHCTDLEKTHFRMHRVPLSSSLEGYFTALLAGNVQLKSRKSGFLTVGFEDKAHLIWNRRWCVLEGRELRYWNYPSEEFTCRPVGSLDLAKASGEASAANRSVCPRPKALCLRIEASEEAVSTYFLAADSQEEKQSWQEEINFVIATLGSWNCLCHEL